MIIEVFSSKFFSKDSNRGSAPWGGGGGAPPPHPQRKILKKTKQQSFKEIKKKLL
jgi:hypothetical protein